MIAGVGCLVARVDCAAHTIITVDRSGGLTILRLMARLRAVAPQAVIAVRVVGDVLACAGGLIARIVGAPDPVVALFINRAGFVTLPALQPTAHSAIVPPRAITRHTSKGCAPQWLASRTPQSATVIPATT